MAYKYLNDDGLKAYTKKVKGALKDLHTPIAISTENTTESKTQNVRNIADFVAKAKAAGITDVNGMAVTCFINDDYSGIGYFYYIGDNIFIQGVLIKDDLIENKCFSVDSSGQYSVKGLIVSDDEYNYVTSDMLTQGARKPIILTPETTEVDEETYQKLLSDDVDVIFKDNSIICHLGEVLVDGIAGDGVYLNLIFYNVSGTTDTTTPSDYRFITIIVSISKEAPHTTGVEFGNYSLGDIFPLSPVLQEIDLTGTDAERKAKLDQFEADWKALTGAGDLAGARFIGHYLNDDALMITGVFSYDVAAANYSALTPNEYDKPYVISLELNGSLTITPLFSHLEPVEIFFDNTAEKKKQNLDNLNAYKANLEQLGVDTSISFQVIFQNGNGEYFGNLYNSGGGNTYIGLIFTVDDNSVGWMRINADGEVVFVDLASEDAIKYSYTQVPLTTTTSTNKTQLDLFLSKVPNAQVMHVTYKDVYAGTLHKINGSWYGVLVGESNTLAGQLSIKLQADGTIVEGTA